MRRADRAGLTGLALAAVLSLAGCGGRGDAPAPAAASFAARAERRAYDGAPPTVPHADPGATCSACHDADGQAVGTRFAPASPHADTDQSGRMQRCRQCHVFATTARLFVGSRFVGLPQTLRAGGRATPGAPPTIPHRLLMREHCVACHAGPGIREEIRTTHPERQRCRQCHVPETTGTFTPPHAAGTEGGGEP